MNFFNMKEYEENKYFMVSSEWIYRNCNALSYFGYLSCNCSDIVFREWTLRIKIHTTLSFDSSDQLSKMSSKMVLRWCSSYCCTTERKVERFIWGNFNTYSNINLFKLYIIYNNFKIYPMSDIRLLSDSENESNSSALFLCSSQTNFGKQCSAITRCIFFSSVSLLVLVSSSFVSDLSCEGLYLTSGRRKSLVER